MTHRLLAKRLSVGIYIRQVSFHICIINMTFKKEQHALIYLHLVHVY